MLITVLLMLSYFLYNSIIVTWCFQKRVNLVFMVGQTNKFQVMFQLPCSIFISINKVKRFLKIFFVDWSIADAKLFFEVPIQPGMMIDDTIRLVCVCTYYCWQKFLVNESAKSVMVWAGDKSQTGLIKTKNCSAKISFIIKLDIYIW